MQNHVPPTLQSLQNNVLTWILCVLSRSKINHKKGIEAAFILLSLFYRSLLGLFPRSPCFEWNHLDNQLPFSYWPSIQTRPILQRHFLSYYFWFNLFLRSKKRLKSIEQIGNDLPKGFRGKALVFCNWSVILCYRSLKIRTCNTEKYCKCCLKQCVYVPIIMPKMFPL